MAERVAGAVERVAEGEGGVEVARESLYGSWLVWRSRGPGSELRGMANH